MIHKYTFEAPQTEVNGVIYQKSPSQWLELIGAQIPVTIENAPYVAEELRKQGIEIKTHKCMAIIDTGASLCIISQSIADELNLHFEKLTPVGFIEGNANRPTYPAVIRFEWGTPFLVPVVACELDNHFECFIGRDILAKLDMDYNGIDGVVSINSDSDDLKTDATVDILHDWRKRTLTFFGLRKKKI
jgi:hypothetical protein